MTDLKNNLEEVWIQRGSFGYVVVKGKDSNPEWINRPFQVCSVNKKNELQQELQKTREHLGKAIKSAEFFMSYADCKRDSWACKCSFCKDTESSKNLREARQYFQDKQGE